MRGHQRQHVLLTESGEGEVGQSVEQVGNIGLSDREQERDRLVLDAPRDERQDLRRGVIEPLRLVDHADDLLFAGGGRQQAEHGQADPEAVRRLAVPQREGHFHGGSLRAGQRLQMEQQRLAEVVQRGEGQLGLELPSDGA